MRTDFRLRLRTQAAVVAVALGEQLEDRGAVDPANLARLVPGRQIRAAYGPKSFVGGPPIAGGTASATAAAEHGVRVTVVAEADRLGEGEFDLNPPQFGVPEADRIGVVLARSGRRIGELVDRLATVVTVLLSRARGDAARPRPVDVADLFDELARHWGPLTDRDGRQLVVATGPDPLLGLANRDHLSQALSVLVENAVRHGGGTIRLAAARDGDVLPAVTAPTPPGLSPVRG